MRKRGPLRDIPPPLELDCLRALWSLGEGNVGQVRAALGPTRNLAYTTVMTVLDRLARKGAVERHKAGRSFLYVPLLSREVLRRLAVKELLDCFFGGSEEELLSYLRGRPGKPAEPQAEPSLDAALL